jgi:quercetin 2,3-dioxygenase
MIAIRKSNDRGNTNIDWLNSLHTFSFADYFDPKNMGFRTLRVINEDYVQPGRGFGTHPHRDMEIITYVLDGSLEHKDSIGNGSIIRPGDVQRMTAGTGILHSEYNPSQTDLVHLLQIWILPDKSGYVPSYEQKYFPVEERRGQLRLVASNDGREGSVKVNQDMSLFASLLDKDEEVTYNLKAGRSFWLQIARGRVDVNGVSLKSGDGAAITEEHSLKIKGTETSEILLFDLI